MKPSYGQMLFHRHCSAWRLPKVKMPVEMVQPQNPKELHMPQNTKDSQGGKNHLPKKTAAKGQTGDKAQAKKSSANSPTGPHKHGEKKTTP